MKSIERHISDINPKFKCKNRTMKKELIVELKNVIGKPANDKQLEILKKISGDEYKYLKPLYEKYNGIQFHVNMNTEGLVVAKISELSKFNKEWKSWFDIWDENNLHDFHKKGFAFATIQTSGNFFIIYKGKVYYSDHDGGDDKIWGETLEGVFSTALNNPVKFLNDTGCFTRYTNAKSDDTYFPFEYMHD